MSEQLSSKERVSELISYWESCDPGDETFIREDILRDTIALLKSESVPSNSAVYEVQEGMDRDLNKQFRVTDTRTDSRVATCYVQSNADLVCAALNAYTADEPAGGLTAPMCPECGWVGDFRTSPPPSASDDVIDITCDEDDERVIEFVFVRDDICVKGQSVTKDAPPPPPQPPPKRVIGEYAPGFRPRDADETSAVHKAHDPTCGVFAGMACDCGWLDEHR